MFADLRIAFAPWLATRAAPFESKGAIVLVLSKNLHLDEVAYFWAQLVCERVELLPGWHHAIASHLPFF